MTSVTGAGRTARLVLLAGAVLALVAPRAALSAAPAVPTLGGTVTVSGTRTAYSVVSVSRTVDFRQVAKYPPRFTGGAYGWLLYLDARPAPGAYAGHLRMPRAEGGTVIFRLGGRDPKTGANPFDTGVIPAGRYRLYLMSNGPGSATFTLPGTSGRTSVAARTGAAAEIADRAFPEAGGYAPPAYADGHAFEARANGALVLAFDWVRSTAQASAVYGSCIYQGGPPAGRWAPGCPGGDTTMAILHGVYLGCCGTGWATAYFPAGRWAYGRWYSQAGLVEDAGIFLVVLHL